MDPEELAVECAQAVRDGAILIEGSEDAGFTGIPAEFWIIRNGHRFLVTVALDDDQD